MTPPGSPFQDAQESTPVFLLIPSTVSAWHQPSEHLSPGMAMKAAGWNSGPSGEGFQLHSLPPPPFSSLTNAISINKGGVGLGWWQRSQRKEKSPLVKPHPCVSE